MDHNLCSDISDIPEIKRFDGYKNKDLIKRLKNLETKVRKISEKAHGQLETSNQSCSKAKTDVEKFRDEINLKLDKVQDRLKNEADDMKYAGVLKIENLENICTTIKNNIDKLSLEFTDLKYENRSCDAYSRLELEIKKIENDIKRAEDKSTINTYSFIANENLLELLKNIDAFGAISAKEDQGTSLVPDTVSTADITNAKLNRTTFISIHSSVASVQNKNGIHTEYEDMKPQKTGPVPVSSSESSIHDIIVLHADGQTYDDEKIRKKTDITSNSSEASMRDDNTKDVRNTEDAYVMKTFPLSNSSAVTTVVSSTSFVQNINPVSHEISDWSNPLTDISAWKENVKTNIYSNTLPTNEQLQKAHVLYKEGTIERELFDSMCNMICEYIQSKGSLIKKVWPSYTSTHPDQVVFVVMCSECFTVTEEYKTETFIIGSCNDEAKTVMYHKANEHTKFSKEEEKHITSTINKHAEHLMSQHKNITMISTCLYRSTGYGTRLPKLSRISCIVIYVEIKGLIPIHDDVLPTFLEVPDSDRVIPVDVRQSGYENYHGAKEYHTDLKQGCMIKSRHNFQGTLGGFFEHDGNTYALTTAHTFLEEIRLLKDCSGTGMQVLYKFEPGTAEINVYQNDVTDEHKIGHIYCAVIDQGGVQTSGVDVAVIKLTNTARFPVSGKFPKHNAEDAGFPIDEPLMYTSGIVYDHDTFSEQAQKSSEVYKFGSETNATKGCIVVQGAVVRKMDYSESQKDFGLTLFNQYEVRSVGDPAISSFATHGDSGALVFAKHNGQRSDLRVIGIVEGGTLHNTCIVTPIWAIFNKLCLNDFRLKSFQVHNENKFWPEIPISRSIMYSNNAYSHDYDVNELHQDITQELAKHASELRQEQNDSERRMTEKLKALENKTNQQNNEVMNKLDRIVNMLSTSKNE